MKFSVDTTVSSPIFTPVVEPRPTEQLFFGPRSPSLAGKTITDAYASLDGTSSVYLYTLIVRCCHRTVLLDCALSS